MIDLGDTEVLVTAARLAFPAMLAHMEHDAPLEAVGWLWDDGTTTRFINQARSPERFAVGTTQMAEALAAVNPDEKNLIAIYHSHPNGNTAPSKYDKEQMKAQVGVGAPYPWLIITPDHYLYAWWCDDKAEDICGMVIHRNSEVLSAV